MPHVRDVGQRRTVLAPVVDDAGQRDASEVDAMVGALARHEDIAPALAARLVVGERDLHCAVDRFGARVDEEDAVQVAGCQLGHARRQFELPGVAARERRDEVELAKLRGHGVGDFLAAVARIDAKET